MSDFEREQKYLVLKWDDLRAALTEEQHNQLSTICADIAGHRFDQGKRMFIRHVVVNEDEPYADQVWRLIEAGQEEP